jgi:hypothetical protein
MWFARGCRPGRMHDTTAVRVEGIDTLLDAYPQVKDLVEIVSRLKISCAIVGDA